MLSRYKSYIFVLIYKVFSHEERGSKSSSSSSFDFFFTDNKGVRNERVTLRKTERITLFHTYFTLGEREGTNHFVFSLDNVTQTKKGNESMIPSL